MGRSSWVEMKWSSPAAVVVVAMAVCSLAGRRGGMLSSRGSFILSTGGNRGGNEESLLDSAAQLGENSSVKPRTGRKLLGANKKNGLTEHLAQDFSCDDLSSLVFWKVTPRGEQTVGDCQAPCKMMTEDEYADSGWGPSGDTQHTLVKLQDKLRKTSKWIDKFQKD